jgi:Zn-dependent protease with chaperone function
LNLKDEFAGRRGKCPKCQGTIHVPKLAAEPALAVAVPQITPQTDPPELARHAGSTTPPPQQAVQLAAHVQAAQTEARPPLAPSPQQLFAQVMSGFSGKLERRRTSPMYQLGIAITAAFMVLLPLIYIGLIALVAWLIVWHLGHNHFILQGARGRAAAFLFLIYLAPVIVGGILVAFMVKPLFNWASRDSRTRSINRGSDPLLFAFVDRICEVVGSPLPARIDIDCDINASAAFEGWFALATNRLVLTIGMPLVAAMPLQQLAGVLAHEFGHFSQGAGMRLTYIIRSINHWFVRVVYERDAWDEWLATSAAEFDLRFGWVLYLAMFFIWITRKVLWCLMMLGHMVAGFMLRQMEFDADTYEARLAGSTTFAATARQLRLLGVAWQGAQADLGSFHREGRLADNLPKLIMANVKQIPDKIHKLIDESIDESKTGLFDTHPSDKERIAAAAALNAPGVFHSDLPATVLFANFDAAAKGVTWDFYRGIFGPQLQPQELHSVDNLLERQNTETALTESLKRYFGGQLPALRPLRLPSSHLAKILDADAAQTRLHECKAIVSREQAAYQELYTRYDDLDTELVHALQMHPLLAADIRIQPPEGKRIFRDRTEASHVRDRLKVELAKLADKLSPYEQAQGERLYLGLGLLFHPRIASIVPDAATLQQQVGTLLPLAAQISSLLDSILTMRNTHAALAALFSHVEGNESEESLIREVIDYANRLHGQIHEVSRLFQTTDYPFDHAQGTMKVSTYLVRQLPTSDAIGEIYQAGDDLIDNIHSLYFRSLSRLCQAAEAVEAALGY